MTPQPAGDAGEVLEATAAQVQDTIDRLAPKYALPHKPEEGTFWYQLQEAITENPTTSTAQKQQFTPEDTLRTIKAATQRATRNTPRPRSHKPPGHDHGIGL
ncbi:hypothetical protein [Propionibacterium australiense]|uniref:Uncharacterized protein n=1 Tax=Propionibacterium australiense TaxID=119981 RepID=A0A383S959_9ACTN|nr:hypothetical protein [Propionibacterium australiense]RLP07601.1 hypothetical protein D9T14_09985 [Propionibacterium australiense]RLP08389.1 hypothetical protein D7U36_09655 [Propionibacterium australiense]SYZ33954.1 Hypothetical protein PROPAUS_1910 [Propionibacterium australiense]VEH88921.1 Uncharacterised protein [Propionibacterium australiense]